MRKIPRPLLLLHDDPVLLERLRTVARIRRMELRRVPGWEELLDAVREAPASALLVVDPYVGVAPGGSPSIELAALLNRFPSLSVTAALAVRPGRLDDLRRLGEWGVVQILDLDEEVTAVGAGIRLLEVRGRPLRNLIERSLPASTSGAARSILSTAATVVAEGGTGADLARSMYITTRTLTRWCRRAGLPPPKRLLAWMRVLLAAELLDDPGRTVSDVALACGYSADSSLRHVFRTFLEKTPGRLRDEGAFRSASQGFVEALAEARSEQTRYRKRKLATS